MELVIKKDAGEGALSAAAVLARLVSQKPECVLGLATGGTPVPVYRELVRRHQEEGLDFSRVTSFNLDEYLGLGPEHPQSYAAYMREHLFDKVPVRAAHLPDGLARDVPGFCAEYEDRIRRSGGIDLQLLGLGSDGHIGFNEPGSSLASRTRIKTLTERTRKDNARYFGSPGEVPKHVLTMGVGTIMDSRHCLLLAFGEKKAKAVAEAFEGPVSHMVPASALQWHPQLTVILDEAAASHLTRADYYRWVYDRKPDWQRWE